MREGCVHRLSFRVFALAAMLISSVAGSAAQEVGLAAPPEPTVVLYEQIAFSEDGRILREIESIHSTEPDQSRHVHVRVVTYDAATGKLRHVRNLMPDTRWLSSTSDGRKLVISEDRDHPDEDSHTFLFDSENGRIRDLPSSWFDHDDRRPFAAISGDGRLVSAYSESGPVDGPVVVSVYNWRTQRLVARQSTGFPAGGFSSGGVTGDRKIEFSNNRTGSNIVDPKSGRLMVALRMHSFRSQDGAWIVEFPNLDFQDAPKALTIKNGANGQVLGKLDLPIKEDAPSWQWRGAFCGRSRRFIAASANSMFAYELPSGKRVASLPVETWQDKNQIDSTPTVACSSNGMRVAIRSGARLTLHDMP
jgi:hypothetical protein